MNQVQSLCNSIERHKFIFVAGLHRSGTSLLFRLLREHPQISGFRLAGGAEREHEGQHHQSVYPPGTVHGGPGYFAFDGRAHLTETSSLATPGNAARLYEEWAKHWDLSKPYLLEKSPPNLVRARFLQKLFPNTYFVVVVRHPVPVSLATFKWMGWPRHYVTHDQGSGGHEGSRVRPAKKTDNPHFWRDKRLFTESMLYTLFEHWRIAHKTFEEDRGRLERVTIVRYEDLVSDKESNIASIARFLDLESQEVTPAEPVEDHNAQYFSQWEGFSTAEVSANFRSLVEDRFGSFFKEYGYLLSGPFSNE